MPSDKCPIRSELAAFAVGKLSEDAGEKIADHLDVCPACEFTVAALEKASDSFVDVLRHPLGWEQLFEEPEFEQAVAKVATIGRETGRAANGETLGFAGQDTSRSASLPEAAPDRDKPKPAIPVEDLPGGGQLRDYRLLEPIGKGGMGAVYKALHTKLDAIVALKVLPQKRTANQQAVARFEREMRVVGQLKHPNIVQALDAGEENGVHYLVMEHVDGFDLSEVVGRCGPLPVADACELVRQAAVGLQYIHGHGLVHRDMKPSNLMLTSNGQVKILDLGLALLWEEQANEEEMTDRGQAVGTADYMAPEQTSDSHHVDIRADIYSLGCTLYRLLGGQTPYTGPKYRSPFEKMTGHARDPVPSIKELRDDLPEKLVGVIERMLSKDPDERPATPEEVSKAMEAFVREADLQQLIRWAEGHPAPPAPAQPDGVTSDLAASVEEEDASHGQYRRIKPSTRRWYPRPTILLALAAAFVFALAVIIAVATNRGTLEIKTYDEDVQVSILKGGREVRVVDTKTDNKVTLYAGEYELRLSGGKKGLRLSTDKFTLWRGDKVIVEVGRLPTALSGRASHAAPDGAVARILPPSLSEGLIGYWTFDEGPGQPIRDHSGRGHDGTLVHPKPNSAFSTDVPFLKTVNRFSLALSDGGQCVSVGTLGEDAQLLGQGTFCAWAKLKPTERIWSLLWGRNSVRSTTLLVHLNTCETAADNERSVPKRARLFWRDALGGSFAIQTHKDRYWFQDGKWHHLAITFDAKEKAGAIYIDGIHQASKIQSGVGTPNPTSFGRFVELVKIGKSWSDNENSRKLDEVRLYRRVLTSAEIGMLADPEAASRSTAAPTRHPLPIHPREAAVKSQAAK